MNPDSLAGEPGRQSNDNHRHHPTRPRPNFASHRGLAHASSSVHAPAPRGCNEDPSTFPSERDVLAAYHQCEHLRQSEIDLLLTLGVLISAFASPFALAASEVTFHANGLYDFTRDGWRDGEVRRAIIIPALGADGLRDLVAWQPEADLFAPWIGRSFALGEEQIFWPRLDGAPLRVSRNPLGWLRAERSALVILRPEVAWSRLLGVPLLAEDEQHAAELDRSLKSPLEPQIYWDRGGANE